MFIEKIYTLVKTSTFGHGKIIPFIWDLTNIGELISVQEFNLSGNNKIAKKLGIKNVVFKTHIKIIKFIFRSYILVTKSIIRFSYDKTYLHLKIKI